MTGKKIETVVVVKFIVGYLDFRIFVNIIYSFGCEYFIYDR
jgi:hypothetical protein